MTAEWIARQSEKRDLTELRVLGTAMADPDLSDEVVSRVGPEMFRNRAHRLIADAVWKLRREGRPCDLDGVQDELIGTGKLDEVGGAGALFDVVTRGEVETRCCDELLTIERRRQVWQACHDGTVKVTNPAVQPDDVAADVAGALHAKTAASLNEPITTDDLLSMQVPDWLVDGIFPAGLSLLFGAPKSGKSYIALQLAWSFATGTNFFRRKCRTEPGNVLYLAGEGVADLKLRVEALIAESGMKDDGRINWWVEGLALAKERDAAKLRLQVERTGAELVIVDTWARYSGLRDENDAALASQAVGALEDLTRKGVSVVVVHHTNAEGGIRGSTAVAGAVESAIRVLRDDDAQRSALISFMARRGPGFSEIEFAWKPSGPDYVLREAFSDV